MVFKSNTLMVLSYPPDNNTVPSLLKAKAFIEP